MVWFLISSLIKADIVTGPRYLNRAMNRSGNTSDSVKRYWPLRLMVSFVNGVLITKMILDHILGTYKLYFTFGHLYHLHFWYGAQYGHVLFHPFLSLGILYCITVLRKLLKSILACFTVEHAISIVNDSTAIIVVFFIVWWKLYRILKEYIQYREFDLYSTNTSFFLETPLSNHL